MSREYKVEKKYSLLDSQSGGDNINKKTQKQIHKEENNNEIDKLSNEFSEMGCIVDAVKRPPNICVETCVYQSDSEEHSQKEEDGYSDEFEEDVEGGNDNIKEQVHSEEVLIRNGHFENDNLELKVTQSGSATTRKPCLSHLTKSRSLMSCTTSSSCYKSSKYGSLPMPQTRRKNMTFSNDRLREIERQNQLLLNKIISARHTRQSSIPPVATNATTLLPIQRLNGASIQRKRLQNKIDYENTVSKILLRKIQRAKSSASSIRR